jgi:hypothetical protein
VRLFLSDEPHLHGVRRPELEWPDVAHVEDRTARAQICRFRALGVLWATATVCNSAIIWVVSQLDEVADRLAQQPLDLRHCCPGVLVRPQERRGLLGTGADVVSGVWMVVSALRRYPRLPDQLTTRRLCEQATGVDRDRANADLALVADRLSPLANAPNGPQGDALVLGASRRLVSWVAGSRPADGQMSDVEAAFTHSVELAEKDRAAPEVIMDSLESHVEAWDAAVRPMG